MKTKIIIGIIALCLLVMVVMGDTEQKQIHTGYITCSDTIKEGCYDMNRDTKIALEKAVDVPTLQELNAKVDAQELEIQDLKKEIELLNIK